MNKQGKYTFMINSAASVFPVREIEVSIESYSLSQAEVEVISIINSLNSNGTLYDNTKRTLIKFEHSVSNGNLSNVSINGLDTYTISTIRNEITSINQAITEMNARSKKVQF